eukprot:Blabericola_migrator_1__3309@NODE_1976_length_3481_cov_37_500586_g1258_i0_p2_GENE_NODE_1976_length_3481_cov_37_500586_g1258_i0NODE_1976_length_3481_cov_37_500586_g1258_i0_p2_ORF_typecomplete_len284_score49_74Arrestin_C/PF02752_22/0_0033Rgp1/PF08737_10/0_005LDB19/PF13002_7/0_0078_NODE_1976_length_3481_cov_37_500586_g1258_i020552906
MQSPLGVKECQAWSALRDQQARKDEGTPLGYLAKKEARARRYSSPSPLGSRKALKINKAISKSQHTQISKKTEVVYHRVINVLHQSQTPHRVPLPTDLPNSINNELIRLSYQLDVEFNCISHNGELLELRADAIRPRTPSPASTPTPTQRSRARKSFDTQRSNVARSNPQVLSPKAASGRNTPQSPGTPLTSPMAEEPNKPAPGVPFLVINGPLLAKNILRAVWTASLIYVNEGKPVNLRENVEDEKVITTSMLLDKSESNLKGQCLIRAPQRSLSFASPQTS